MVDKSIVQPKNSKTGKPNYMMGGKRSVRRLEILGFDPIGELVATYNKLGEELLYYEGWRDGTIVPLTSTGKVRSYYPEAHLALYDKRIKIGEALLRYGYGRVPETVDQSERAPMPLIVNLTKKGEVYKVNEVADEESFDIIEGDFYDSY